MIKANTIRRKCIAETRETLARAAATDAANRRIRSEGRTVWNEEDYNFACQELERLSPTEVLLRELRDQGIVEPF
jgi:hypothetical protein